jgi:hypothetical protein
MGMARGCQQKEEKRNGKQRKERSSDAPHWIYVLFFVMLPVMTIGW